MYTVNGEEPKIIGVECEGFYLTQFQENFEVKDSANVAHLSFQSKWYRLYFEADTIFWRESVLPGESVNSSFDSSLVLVNLNEMSNVVGSTVKNINYFSSEIEVGVEITFSSGFELVFIHDSNLDITRVKC